MHYMLLEGEYDNNGVNHQQVDAHVLMKAVCVYT